MYVFTDMHEIFFGEFPKIMTEWLERLVEKKGRFSLTIPKNWTPKLLRFLNSVINPTTQKINFWLDSVIRGYVTKFAVDYIQSYNIIER
jgi:hypothetical protein